MGKILFNLFILYLVWQFIKMFFAVKGVQKGFNEKINDLNKKVNEQKSNTNQSNTKNKKDDDGEYVDFEEIK